MAGSIIAIEHVHPKVNIMRVQVSALCEKVDPPVNVLKELDRLQSKDASYKKELDFFENLNY